MGWGRQDQCLVMQHTVSSLYSFALLLNERMESWSLGGTEFPLPLVCSQTFMIQEEQRESCVTHDHALVHTAFSFYSHQKSRIKYFLVKKKKKKNWEHCSLLECQSWSQCGGQQFQILLCSALTLSARESTRLFDLGFKSYVDSLCHSNQFLLQPFDISWLCIRFYW